MRAERNGQQGSPKTGRGGVPLPKPPRDSGVSELYERQAAAMLACELVGRAIPAVRLATFEAAPVALSPDLGALTVIYIYPASSFSPDGGGDSAVADAAQHAAFDRHCDDLRAHSVRAVGLSSEGVQAQRVRVLAHRIGHELWSDPDLELARALDLPTFSHAGGDWYRRMTIVARGSRVEKVFFPVESPERSAAQVIWWMKATGR